jgi:hypothetical protein
MKKANRTVRFFAAVQSVSGHAPATIFVDSPA